MVGGHKTIGMYYVRAPGQEVVIGCHSSRRPLGKGRNPGWGYSKVEHQFYFCGAARGEIANPGSSSLQYRVIPE